MFSKFIMGCDPAYIPKCEVKSIHDRCNEKGVYKIENTNEYLCEKCHFNYISMFEIISNENGETLLKKIK